jgi:hypothetical protein
MRFIAGILFVLAAVSSALAGAAPLTVKEIALMLRSGYSNETILHDLSARYFADNFDSETETQLLRAGANSSLIETLRSGTYQMSATQVAAAKMKMATPPAKTGNMTIHPDANAAQSHSAPAEPLPDSIYSRLKGDLVYLHQGSLVPFDDEELEQKKLYLLFFSANWSAPGRKFTPHLVEYYNRLAPQHPEFELVFFSLDHSQFGMETYVAQSNMPWPAVAYDKVAAKASDFRQNLVREIPCLMLVDAAGNILSRSAGGEDDSSLGKVLADLDQIFARGTDSARTRPR